jgi:hypothetical protein
MVEFGTIVGTTPHGASTVAGDKIIGSPSGQPGDGATISTLGRDIITALPKDLRPSVFIHLIPEVQANMRLVSRTWHDNVEPVFRTFNAYSREDITAIISRFKNLETLKLGEIKDLNANDIAGISSLHNLKNVTFHQKMMRDASFFDICLDMANGHKAIIEALTGR